MIKIFKFTGLLILCVLATMASDATAKSEEPTKDQLTPFLLKVLDAPQAVKGSDGRFHLVYELQLTNASRMTWEIQNLKVIARSPTHRTLSSSSGENLKEDMAILGSRQPTVSLTSGQSAILWIHLKFSKEAQIPKELSHRLSLRSAHREMREEGGAVMVGTGPAPVLSPPLRGKGWLAGDGCCEAHRHVRALLPINGRLYSAQRFAIDWELLNEENRLYRGDKFKVESYFSYGKDVYAVADGKVVGKMDGLPNQIPGKLPENIQLEEADGNHVIQDLGGGRYALYAHMIPGSIVVKKGQVLKKGQVIGKVGNSGNSSAPHLHFHVMDSPSALASNGLPYVLDPFELLGRAPSTEAFDEAEAKGTPLKVLKVKSPATRSLELPLDLSMLGF